jgi:hypothetical protein
VLSFRGQPRKLIVVYCDYGQTSGEAAQQFAERDFDNVFLLRGGVPDLVGPGEPPRPESAAKGSPKAGGRRGRRPRQPRRRKRQLRRARHGPSPRRPAQRRFGNKRSILGFAVAPPSGKASRQSGTARGSRGRRESNLPTAGRGGWREWAECRRVERQVKNRGAGLDCRMNTSREGRKSERGEHARDGRARFRVLWSCLRESKRFLWG